LRGIVAYLGGDVERFRMVLITEARREADFRIAEANQGATGIEFDLQRCQDVNAELRRRLQSRDGRLDQLKGDHRSRLVLLPQRGALPAGYLDGASYRTHVVR
jgi:hypothetical protein